MWRVFIMLAFWGDTGCDKNPPPRAPADGDDGGQIVIAGCDSVEASVKALYTKAADSEEVADNLLPEYLDANIHMVMNDCRAQEDRVLPCLKRVKNVHDMEANCLLQLHDDGAVEAEQFGQR